jgi:hypothetical protein
VKAAQRALGCDAVGGQLASRLKKDLTAMSENKDSLPRRDRFLDDGRSNVGLAGTGRCDNNHAALACCHDFATPLDDVELIRAQLGHGRTLANAFAIIAWTAS